jgi:predicted dehydrogenase
VSEIRWGIAATGGIARAMTATLATLPDATVIAVGSRSLERATAFAAEHGIPRPYGSHEELVADPDVEIVYIASPISAHESMTIAALDAGKHVLCEKAFAVNTGQAQRMAEAARRNRRFLMEAMWTWFLPPIVEVRELVHSGAIGRITSIRSDFCVPVAPGSRHLDAQAGGGALLDRGIYSIALSQLLLGGPPSAVHALATIGETGVDTNVAGLLHHGSGAISAFQAGLESLSEVSADIIGTEGAVTLHRPFHCPSAYTIRRNGSEPVRVEVPHRGLAHEAEHAMQRIRGGHLESDVVPLATSIAMMQTLDDIRSTVGLRLPGDEAAGAGSMIRQERT